MMKKIMFLCMLLTAILTSSAQIVDPIKWNTSVKMDNDTEGTVTLDALIEDGWHLYSLSLPEGGPNPTTITFDEVEGIVFTDEVTPSRPAKEQVDMMFHLKLGWWDADVSFTRNFKITQPGSHKITGTVSFQGCNDQTCVMPKKESFSLMVGTPAATEENEAEATPTTVIINDHTVKASADGWWEPVKFDNGSAPISQSPWWLIFIWGFGGGLLALLTPCVWPMIPMTVSFFLKKNGNKGKSVRDAAIYGV